MAKTPDLRGIVQLFRTKPAWLAVLTIVLGYRGYRFLDKDTPDAQGTQLASASSDKAGSASDKPAPAPRKQGKPDKPEPESKRDADRPAKAAGPANARDLHTISLLDWNLENFSGLSLSQAPDRPKGSQAQEGPPKRGHDLSAIRGLMRDKAPDLVTFQEVVAPKELAKVFPSFSWSWTRHGGRGQQYLALGVRKGSEIECRALPDLEDLSARKTVRPGLRARCKHPQKGDFEVLAVHLKAGTKGHSLRTSQWSTIFKTLRKSRVPTIVVGDLNFAGTLDPGGPRDDKAERSTFTSRAKSQAQLQESQLSLPCTAYWEGPDRRDGLLEPSALDGIWLRGFGDKVPKAQVLGACKAKSCGQVRRSRGKKAAAMAGLSDHCPLLVEIATQ